jgi:predicted permease
MQVRGQPPAPGQLPPLVQMRRSFTGYFETLRVPLVSGRLLEPADLERREGVIVLSRRAAELYFPGGDPLGKEMTFLFEVEGRPWYRVVGVVGDTPVARLDEDPYPVVYFPALDPVPGMGAGIHNLTFVVRTSGPPMATVPSVRTAAAAVNPSVALGHVRSMEMIVSSATERMAFTMLMLLIAASIALALGAVGIYGVISYIVEQRTGEIGVRLALGARPTDVAAMVLRQSVAVVSIGVLLGLAGAAAVSRVMTSLLYQVSATDALTYVGVTSFLVAVAVVASWLPARRAAALDPVIALRAE